MNVAACTQPALKPNVTAWLVVQSLLAAGHQHFLENLQGSILRRLSKTLWSRHEPVVYEFTNDRALLHQYYHMREIMYRKMSFVYDYVGEEDEYDKISHILIARRGRLCVGGCRLTTREADEDFLLPMESPDFKLRDVLPNLLLRKFRHGEISRFAVLDDDDDKLDVMLALSQLIIEKCVSAGLGFAFIKSNLPMARNWRKIGQTHCGLEKMRICTEIKVPEYPLCPEVKWYISEITMPAAEESTALRKERLAVTVDSLFH